MLPGSRTPRRGAHRAKALASAGLLLVALCASAATASGTTSDSRHAPAHKPHAKQPKRKPKPKPTYWGAWIGPQLTGVQPPWDMSAVSQFEALVGKGLSLVEFATPFASCHPSPCSYFGFPTEQMQNIRDYGAIPVLGWNSSGSPADVYDPGFQFADVISGAHDAYIRRFAEETRDWGAPFFLRFNWEMNGNWFAWSEGVNGNQPGEFVAAWRHVHDIFTSVGATNATWVWCPYSDPNRKFGGVGRFYPGDEYVDWTCMDGFNWYRNPTNPHPWRSFDQIFRSTYRQIVRRVAPSKPVMLAELASTGRSRAKATWIRNMFKMLATRYGRIRAVIWFDQVDRGIDWPLETSPAATRAFAQGVGASAFKGNGEARISASPIPAPG